MTEVGCPNCGAVIQTAPPNTTHLSFTTVEPNESNKEKYIERILKCSDPTKIPTRRMPHEFKIYWHLKGVLG